MPNSLFPYYHFPINLRLVITTPIWGVLLILWFVSGGYDTLAGRLFGFLALRTVGIPVEWEM